MKSFILRKSLSTHLLTIFEIRTCPGVWQSLLPPHSDHSLIFYCKYPGEKEPISLTTSFRTSPDGHMSLVHMGVSPELKYIYCLCHKHNHYSNIIKYFLIHHEIFFRRVRTGTWPWARWFLFPLWKTPESFWAAEPRTSWQEVLLSAQISIHFLSAPFEQGDFMISSDLKQRKRQSFSNVQIEL